MPFPSWFGVKACFRPWNNSWRPLNPKPWPSYQDLLHRKTVQVAALTCSGLGFRVYHFDQSSDYQDRVSVPEGFQDLAKIRSARKPKLHLSVLKPHKTCNSSCRSLRLWRLVCLLSRLLAGTRHWRQAHGQQFCLGGIVTREVRWDPGHVQLHTRWYDSEWGAGYEHADFGNELLRGEHRASQLPASSLCYGEVKLHEQAWLLPNHQERIRPAPLHEVLAWIQDLHGGLGWTS